MILNNWNKRDGLSSKVLNSVRQEAPLKNKIDEAQQKLQIQVTKLDSIHIKLQKKHDMIFERIVSAQKNHNTSYAKAYATELAQVRKMKSMVGNAKLSMEQIQLRLNTVSELGDVVVTLSPCMSIIKGLGSSIGGIMPEANASMQDLSSILGDVMNNSSMGSVDMGISEPVNGDASAILSEAQSMIERQTKSSIPDIPTSLRDQAGRKTQTLI